MQRELFTDSYLETYRQRYIQAYLLLDADEQERGHLWYYSHNVTFRHLATTYHKTIEQVCEAAAWLSVGSHWDKHAVPQLIRMLQAGPHGMDVPATTYKRLKEHAFHVLMGRNVSFLHTDAPKVSRFVENLLDPEHSKSVTCDSHHFRLVGLHYGVAANGKSKIRPNLSQYRAIERVTQEAAYELGIDLPHKLQASIWPKQRKGYKWPWMN